MTTVLVQSLNVQLDAGPSSPAAENLGKFYASLSEQPTQDEIADALSLLTTEDASIKQDESVQRVTEAILAKLVVGIYSQALEGYLKKSEVLEAEADWWEDVERSRLNLIAYFIQTLPIRLVNVFRTVVQSLRERDIPVHWSAFTPSSLRTLFPSHSVFTPNALTLALFPHLKQFPTTSHTIPKTKPSYWAKSIADWANYPLHLTLHECTSKRKALQDARNHHAELLGTLVNMRDRLRTALTSPSRGDGLAVFISAYQTRIRNSSPRDDIAGNQAPNAFLLSQVQDIAKFQPAELSTLIQPNLSRPSRLTLLWPRLVILPPLTLLVARKLYSSRTQLYEFIDDIRETVARFYQDWLVDPIKGVINTIRAGGEDGVIIQKEGVAADRASLERMTLALARDRLKFDEQQLSNLREKVQVGDLTTILELYEDDIKSPIKSAVSGTLLRSVFVQVQKAKVDIDQTLAGIDKLLKSQELTFAFVGVAPALTLVYIAAGYFASLLNFGRGTHRRYGSKKQRRNVWNALRRIERLLIFQPKSQNAENESLESQTTQDIPPLTAGLLLLSVSRMRRYAESRLPSNTPLKEGFLQDVDDLEDPSLGRAEKLRIVDRIWRTWGSILVLDRAIVASSV